MTDQPPPVRLAYLDESHSDQRADPHTYVLAAAIGDDVDLVAARSTIIKLKLKGQHKLHWRDENDKRRVTIAESVAGLGLDHLVVIRDGRPREKPERRRRHCLERMLHELDQLKVARAIFESRGGPDDRRDREMLDALRSQHAISPWLRMDHIPGPSEAMLWVPDAVCGAIVRYRLGDTRFMDILNAATSVRMISLDHR